MKCGNHKPVKLRGRPVPRLTSAMSSAELQCELARTRALLREERANCESARVKRDGYKETVAFLERERDEVDAWRENAERDLAFLRAHPIQLPRQREKLPDTRIGDCIKIRINSRSLVEAAIAAGTPPEDAPKITSLHLILGFYPDGRFGEAFIRLDRDRRYDSSSSFADAWLTVMSFALQHGLSVGWILAKARYVHDESAGVPFVWDKEHADYMPHPIIRHVTSAVDYIAQIIERVLAGRPAAKATPEEIAALRAACAEPAAATINQGE